MANRAKNHNRLNHKRQLAYLAMGVVMLPKKGEIIREILKKNGVEAT